MKNLKTRKTAEDKKFKADHNNILKENLIKLVDHHKDHCDGSDCGISLYNVLSVAKMAGIKFTDDEVRHFL